MQVECPCCCCEFTVTGLGRYTTCPECGEQFTLVEDEE